MKFSDLPEGEFSDYRECQLNGNYHNDGGPARMWHDESYEWFQHHKLHRMYGPAICYRAGPERELEEQHWYLNGTNITNDVYEWMIECDINQNWQEWTDADKILFKMRFS